MKTKSILNNAGIYKITNKVNGKFYIGSTVNIRKRWKGHRNVLKKGKHENQYLQRTYSKYGEDVFVYEVVEFIDINNLSDDLKKDKILSREQYYLDTLTPWKREVGYNLTKIASNFNIGVKHTDVSRKKMSIAHIGNKHTEESKRKISESQFKTVYQIDKCGVLINTFSSCLEAERITGIQRQLISMCCRGVTKTAKGFIWSYNIDKFQLPNLNRKIPCLVWKRVKRQISNGTKTWESVNQCCKDLNINTKKLKVEIQNKNLFYVT